jgi:hypothetical protein
VLYLITFVTSIPAALVLYDPVLNDTGYITGAGSDARVALGAFLELLLIIANIGTAVVPFSIRDRQGIQALAHPHRRPSDRDGPLSPAPGSAVSPLTPARFRIPDARTEAGVGGVQMSPELVEEFDSHFDRLRRAASPPTPRLTRSRTRGEGGCHASASPRSCAMRPRKRLPRR